MREKSNRNRIAAQQSGAETYEGRKCRHCGGTERWTESKMCFTCKGTATQKQRDYASEYYQRTKESRRKQRMLSDARQRANISGLDFNITLEDIVIPEVCPVFNTPMVSPSLDRKDNTKGYVKGNVFVISNRANLLKRDATAEELEAILAYIRRT